MYSNYLSLGTQLQFKLSDEMIGVPIAWQDHRQVFNNMYDRSPMSRTTCGSLEKQQDGKEDQGRTVPTPQLIFAGETKTTRVTLVVYDRSVRNKGVT